MSAVPPDTTLPPGAVIQFIGIARTPWITRADCPKNMGVARERGQPAEIVIDAEWRAGLAGLAAFSHVIVLTWLDEARRDLLQLTPAHVDRPTGVFALRSPVRPNPVGVSVARLVGLDAAAGILWLDALDCRDATPVIDVKPYLPSVDAFPDARTRTSPASEISS